MPGRARIALDGPAAADLAATGFPIRRDVHVSLPVSIVTETDDEFLLLAGTGTFRIQKRFVKGLHAKVPPYRSGPSDALKWERADIDQLADQLSEIARSNSCPKGEVARVEGFLHDEVMRARIPRLSANVSWQCGDQCYQAINELGELIGQEEKRCGLDR